MFNFNPSSHLTKHALGSIKELYSVSWPLMISLFFVCITNLMDRFFLEKYSLKALEACSIATYLILLFQVPCIRIASMSQVFVGQYKGSKSDHSIGAVVWQAIWFSFLSTILTLPLGLFAANLFFPLSIQSLAMKYFTLLIQANCLFPLGAALSTFYTGQGRSSVVSAAMFASSILHLLLDVVLIFGVKGWMAPQGIAGAAYATIISQLFYCLLLFALFMRKQEQVMYKTHQWKINYQLMKQYIMLGAPTAISKLCILSAWVAAVKIITGRGGDYLLVLSITGNLCIFFSCLTEGMGQGLLTIASYLIGSDNKAKVLQAAKSAVLLLTLILGVLACFLLVFPRQLIEKCFITSFSQGQLQLLIHACYGLWLFFLAEGTAWIGLSILTACGDTQFLMRYNAITSWIFTFFPVYLTFNILNGSPMLLWMIMTIPCFASFTAYMVRIYWKFNTFSKLIY